MSCDMNATEVDKGINLFCIGDTFIRWQDTHLFPDRSFTQQYLGTTAENTERELAVPRNCVDLYKPSAVDLAGLLMKSGKPPTVLKTTRGERSALIQTTSGHTVALRVKLPARSRAAGGATSAPVALFLPKACDLAAWFRAFLIDVHTSDPDRVPQAPPQLSQPSDWYTPKERLLARRISHLECKIERLSHELFQLQNELAEETERADRGIRQGLWAYGEELTSAVQGMLEGLGFSVSNMDEKLGDGGPKREDLRLTIEGLGGWEAIVEVKGYPSGTKTNDARQIREHREQYFSDTNRLPDLTLWVANPYRRMEPSSRPAPDDNVESIAEAVGAVHVLVPDIYRQWALVAADIIPAEVVRQSLMNAEPGVWIPPASTPTESPT